jgi:hypothetical protein
LRDGRCQNQVEPSGTKAGTKVPCDKNQYKTMVLDLRPFF